MRIVSALLGTAGMVLVVALMAAPARAASCPGQHAASSSTQAREATVCLLNAERRERGLPELRDQSGLRSLGGRFAARMIRDGFFAHQAPGGPTLGQRLRDSRYGRGAKRLRGGENLGLARSPRDVVNTWMASAGHRANILDRRFRDVGIGVATGTPSGGRGLTFVAVFGSRRR